MFLKAILFILIGFLCYLTVEKVREDKILEKINNYINLKNQKYYDEYIKNYEKNKKVKLVERLNINYKINLLIDKAGMQRNLFINPLSLMVLGIICVVVFYNLAFSFFKVFSLSLIASIPCVLFPFIILSSIGTYKEEKLEKVFLNFLLQLKNHAKISNDITSAFREVETIEPLQSFINKFNIELNSGIKFAVAMEHLKEKISITKFKEFFSNVQYCYLYGGNFTELIEKNYNMISELQNEKNKRLQETKGARMVLVVLMLLNLFVYITYIKNNYENYLIMQKSVIGMMILYWNFISMWLLIWLSNKVKKLDY